MKRVFKIFLAAFFATILTCLLWPIFEFIGAISVCVMICAIVYFLFCHFGSKYNIDFLKE